MFINYKDREPEVEKMRMALAMCEFVLNYEQTEFILEVIEAVKENENFSMNDASEMIFAWQNRWREYAKAQKKIKESESKFKS